MLPTIDWFLYMRLVYMQVESSFYWISVYFYLSLVSLYTPFFLVCVKYIYPSSPSRTCVSLIRKMEGFCTYFISYILPSLFFCSVYLSLYLCYFYWSLPCRACVTLFANGRGLFISFSPFTFMTYLHTGPSAHPLVLLCLGLHLFSLDRSLTFVYIYICPP